MHANDLTPLISVEIKSLESAEVHSSKHWNDLVLFIIKYCIYSVGQDARSMQSLWWKIYNSVCLLLMKLHIICQFSIIHVFKDWSLAYFPHDKQRIILMYRIRRYIYIYDTSTYKLSEILLSKGHGVCVCVIFDVVWPLWSYSSWLIYWAKLLPQCQWSKIWLITWVIRVEWRNTTN